MTLETERLVLRPFTTMDAADLYEFSRLPQVADAAGWPVHKSVEDSRRVIATVFSAPETYAVVEKESGKVIGSVGFTGRRRGNFESEDELGYSLHPDWWGNGLMPEAATAVLHHGFEDLGLEAVWCSHYDGNRRSQRVIEKMGFYPVMSEVLSDDLGEHLTHFYMLTREDWNSL